MSVLYRRDLLIGLAAVGCVAPLGLSFATGYINERVKGPGYSVYGAKWLMGNFGPALKEATSQTPFSTALLCAIAYQESGYFWWRKKWLSGKTPEQVLRLIVLDDVAPRKRAFPSDTAAFLADPRYVQVSADLIAASDDARVEQGGKRVERLRYGYGIFQNDLQNIESHPEFWTSSPASSPGSKGLWGDIGHCAEYCLRELKNKYNIVGGDVYRAVRAYNGRGESAENYLYNVRVYEKAIIEAGL